MNESTVEMQQGADLQEGYVLSREARRQAWEAEGLQVVERPQYAIRIAGELRGKQRARVTMRGGHARAYTPGETVNAEAFVKMSCVQQVGSPMLLGPVSVSIFIGVSVPKSYSKKKAEQALDGRLRPTGKPDIDNCVKLLMDALNGVMWKDDAQVVCLLVDKYYVAEPLALVTVDVL